MTPVYDERGCTVYHGDCLEVMRAMPENSVDAIVTDPPYHLTQNSRNGSPRKNDPKTPFGRTRLGEKGFMGKTWDGGDIAFRPEVWQEAIRVLRPGGHMVAFGGTRTHHRLVCAIEDAGFEVRETLCWIHGQGFPKSLDVGKAIDRQGGRIGESVIELKRRLIDLADASGKTRSQLDKECGFRAANYLRIPSEGKRHDPWVGVLPTGEKWLKMKSVLGCNGELDTLFTAAEREVIAKGVSGKTAIWNEEGMMGDFNITAPSTDAAKRWDGFGSALKPALELIALCRKPLAEPTIAANVLAHGTGAINVGACRVGTDTVKTNLTAMLSHGGENHRPWHDGHVSTTTEHTGRWPANVLHDGSPGVMDAFAAFGQSKSTGGNGAGFGLKGQSAAFQASGKAIVKYGPHGLGYGDSGSPARFFQQCPPDDLRFHYCPKAGKRDRAGSKHPTIKPQSLLRWLSRLICPPGGTILDPFAGSGSTGQAALAEGFKAILIEKEAEYISDIQERLRRLHGVSQCTTNGEKPARFEQPSLPFEEVA